MQLLTSSWICDVNSQYGNSVFLDSLHVYYMYVVFCIGEFQPN